MSKIIQARDMKSTIIIDKMLMLPQTISSKKNASVSNLKRVTLYTRRPDAKRGRWSEWIIVKAVSVIHNAIKKVCCG